MKPGIIIFPLFCLFLSFAVLITDPAFTTLLLKNPNSIEPTQQLREYFLGKSDIPGVFNTQEQAHLKDVKQLINIAFIITAVLAVLLFYTFDKNVAKNGTLILVAILLLAAIIPFDTVFTTFHQITFPQGNWVFPADSTLITFYPITFFTQYAVAIAINSLVAAVALIIVSRTG